MRRRITDQLTDSSECHLWSDNARAENDGATLRQRLWVSVIKVVVNAVPTGIHANARTGREDDSSPDKVMGVHERDKRNHNGRRQRKLQQMVGSTSLDTLFCAPKRRVSRSFYASILGRENADSVLS